MYEWHLCRSSVQFLVHKFIGDFFPFFIAVKYLLVVWVRLLWIVNTVRGATKKLNEIRRGNQFLRRECKRQRR